MIEKRYKREWLNKKEGRAFVELESGLNDSIGGFKVGDNLSYYDAHLHIGDCYKQITLEFDVYMNQSKAEILKDVEDRKYKLSVLKEVINSLEEDLGKIVNNIDELHKLTKEGGVNE